MNKVLDLQLGNGLDKMKRLKDGAVQLWVTSPPYEDARAKYSNDATENSVSRA